MDEGKKEIYFVGSGAIATAMGNVLAMKKGLKVTLLGIEPDVVDAISEKHINHKYFPNMPLHKKLHATYEASKLKKADIIFMAIPSSVTIDYIKEHSEYIREDTIIVNLSKGFGTNNCTIAHCLDDMMQNPVCSLKGPTFARDLINNMPTAFTLAAQAETYFPIFTEIFEDTSIYLDYSTDLSGVELLSILKNIYAIATGIADAQFNSANMRFLLLTKAFREMRDVLLHFGGMEETMFKYCGYGDFSLTALNDLSRNRTLGLLIGKGFFSKFISDEVILEGRIAVNIFTEEISRNNSLEKYPIINEMYKVFNKDYDVSSFVGKILRV